MEIEEVIVDGLDQQTIDKLLKDLYFKDDMKNVKNTFNEFFLMVKPEHFELKLRELFAKNLFVTVDALNLILENTIKQLLVDSFIFHQKVNLKETLQHKFRLNCLVVKKAIDTMFQTAATNVTIENMDEKIGIDDVYNLLGNYELENKAFVECVFMVFNTISKTYVDSLYSNIVNKYLSSVTGNVKPSDLFDNDMNLVKSIHFNFDDTKLLNLFENLINFIEKQICNIVKNKPYSEDGLNEVINRDEFLTPVLKEIYNFMICYCLTVIYNLFNNVRMENVKNEIFKYC